MNTEQIRLNSILNEAHLLYELNTVPMASAKRESWLKSIFKQAKREAKIIGQQRRFQQMLSREDQLRRDCEITLKKDQYSMAQF